MNLSTEEVTGIRLSCPDSRVLRLCDSHEELRRLLLEAFERVSICSALLTRAAEREDARRKTPPPAEADDGV